MRVKQKLRLELKNTPTGAPQAGRSVSSELNKVERPSARSVRLDCNNADVDQRRVNSGQDICVPAIQMTRVFVLSNQNEPLMPCSPRKARVLLKEGRASVVSARPFFTIKLNQQAGGNKQPIKMGIDTGYEYIGFALVGIYCYLVGQIRLDTKMSTRLTDRAMYRRGRRNKHHWYRPARRDNRANARKKGKLPPSVQRRLNRHIWVIAKLQSICPVTNLIIEGAVFDIQKINNPEIKGVGYQQGSLYRSNIRAYLFARENSKCQYCDKKIEQGERVEIHHIKHRSQGGTDKPSNLALLHDTCHQKMHAKSDFGKLKKNNQFKAETFMNSLRKRLFERFPDAVETFGYETSAKRKELGLPKEHYIDAFVIAGGTDQSMTVPSKLIERRRNNRSLQIQKNGKKPSIRKRRYPLQPYDLFWVGKKRYTVTGTHSLGKRVLTKCKKHIATAKITRCYHFGTVAFEF